MFPGDPEFSRGNYGDLSYGYVLNAIARGSEMKQVDAYHAELPIAQLTSLTANQQRDPKKVPNPYTAESFCFFRPKSLENLPSGRYGSAAVAMVEAGTYPAWALFCFKELNQKADPNYKPKFPALVSENAILLHPVRSDAGYTGLLIAREAASESMVAFKGLGGEPIPLWVPKIKTKVIAEEGVTLEATAP
jgi:hypothetical protein